MKSLFQDLNLYFYMEKDQQLGGINLFGLISVCKLDRRSIINIMHTPAK